MKKIAAFALSLCVLSSATFAQSVPPTNLTAGALLVPGGAPTIVVAGGVAGGGIALAILPLVLLAALSGSNGTPGTPGT